MDKKNMATRQATDPIYLSVWIYFPRFVNSIQKKVNSITEDHSVQEDSWNVLAQLKASCQASVMELFYENRQRVKVVNYFRKNAAS